MRKPNSTRLSSCSGDESVWELRVLLSDRLFLIALVVSHAFRKKGCKPRLVQSQT